MDPGRGQLPLAVAVTTTVRLLGRPDIERDGAAVAMRGHKPWLLLAVLVGRGDPISRSRLAAMLFDQADDPLGALRWTLAQLRRSLGPGVGLDGDPLTIGLGPDVVVDLDVLERGTWSDAVSLPGIGDELLSGIVVPDNEALEAWLAAERARVSQLAAGQLLDAALSCLASDRPEHAADLAARLVELQPLDEGHHELLIRALARAGQADEARQHAVRATELLTRELGCEPSTPLLAAAEFGSVRGGTPTMGRAGVLAQLEAGDAAVSAGAVDAGLECLRRAAREAHDLGDSPLEIRALTRLGSALIHGVRGRDAEGAVTLHDAVELGETSRRVHETAAAHRELAWVAVQQGRHHQAHSWLDRAAGLADDDAERSRVVGVRGLTFDDEGSHAAALAAFHDSQDLASSAGERRQVAWVHAMRARTYLQLGDYGQAEPEVHACLAIIRRENWNAFLPYPETQLAELQLRAGDRTAAVENLEHAFALSCHLGDPCWEAMAARGLAEAEAEQGAIDDAVTRLHDARARTARHPDTYRWVVGQVIGAMCEIGVANQLPATRHWIDELEAVAAAAGLRDLVVGAHLHRADLGDAGALAAATLLAQDLDNPRFAHMRETTV